MARNKRSKQLEEEEEASSPVGNPVGKSGKKRKKKNKKKLLSLEEENPRPPKAPKPNEEAKEELLNLEAGNPWTNLDLILSLQNKDFDLQRKVELAFSFVSLRDNGGDEEDGCEVVKKSRLVVFVSDWVQSLLVSADKKVKFDGQVVEACLDYRCWVVFKFCLEESLRFKVHLSLSRNLLRAISCVARTARVLLGNGTSLGEGDGFRLYGVVLECVSLVFRTHGGVSNDNLELWVSAVGSVLELAIGVCNLGVGELGMFGLRFSCLVLEPFAKFLRIHPAKKNGFREFVEKLLEPLLCLMSVLRSHLDEDNLGCRRDLLSAAKEVLSQGLFHPGHVDGFLSLCATGKYSSSDDGKVIESIMEIRSYHRHLFDKIENISASNKDSSLSSLGDLFHLLVHRVMRQNSTSLLSDETKTTDKIGSARPLPTDVSNHVPTDKSGLCNLNTEKRKSLIDAFVLIMEPLLLKMSGYHQSKMDVGPWLLDVHLTLVAINNLLARFLLDKLYIKTEDNSEGGCLKFLKKVHKSIFSFAANFLSLPNYDVDDQTQEILISLAKDLLVSVGYMLDIEYEVTQNDNVGIWLLMLSYSAISHLFKRSPEQCPLISKICGLGCQLVKLYSELRQVKIPIFALCKALRIIGVSDNDYNDKLSYGGVHSCKPSVPYEAHSKSVGKLLCTQEFRLALQNGIKSIPEGQVSEFIRQLGDDMSETMDWLKLCGSVAGEQDIGKSTSKTRMLTFNLQAELLGRGLSEVYAVVLNSVTITRGNSILVGRAVGDLVSAIQCYFTNLVGLHSGGITEFLSSIMGGTLVAGEHHDSLEFRASAQWIFVFFFQLYISCRSLYRLTISLVPPSTSKKMSITVGDPVTAYAGSEWMDMNDWIDEGYFSWIVQPSASVLCILQSISETYGSDGTTYCSTLIYLLHAMAIQRLVDLNRQIYALDYTLEGNDDAERMKLLEDKALSLPSKKIQKWRKHCSVLRQEAAGLTDFLMSHVPLVENGQFSVEKLSHATHAESCLQESGKWDLIACSINEKSLPTALWWILCHNLDIWSIHASKKKLKLFLSHVICTSIPHITTRSFSATDKPDRHEGTLLSSISEVHISSKLVKDSIFYEQKFVCRHLASCICLLLEKSVPASLHNLLHGNISLSSSSCWQEVISSLENLSSATMRRKHRHDKLSGEKSTYCVSFGLRACTTRATGLNLSACQRLLHFLCWMPKEYTSTRSLSLYASCILNIERIIIGSLLQCQEQLSSDELVELLSLLVSCRRTLKYIIMAYCEKKSPKSNSSVIPILSEDPYSVLWLLKSVSAIIELQETVPDHSAGEMRNFIFSLVDHTSHMVLVLSNFECSRRTRIRNAENSCEGMSDFNLDQEQTSLKESTSRCYSKDSKSWTVISVVSGWLKEQTQGLLTSIKGSLGNLNVRHPGNFINLSKSSFIVSCFGGSFWGMSCTLDHIITSDSDHKEEHGACESELVSQIKDCINVFIQFSTYLLRMFCKEAEHIPETLLDMPSTLNGEHHKRPEDDPGCSASDARDDHENSGYSSTFRDAKSVASVLNNIESCGGPLLDQHLLQSLLEGAYPETAILVRQLLLASSAILRLKLHKTCTLWSASSVSSFVNMSQFLLSKLSDMADVPPFSFVWLDGALRYMQEVGRHFSSTSPNLTRNVYCKWIELHLKALGKCILLQGKQASLASQENESNTNVLNCDNRLSESSLSHWPRHVNEFKFRLRMSIIGLIQKPSQLHLLSAIQAIERALVGAHEGCTAVYNITRGNTGGRVSSTVAAGVDCLDLVLEYVSGCKRWNVLKIHIKSLIAALFSIVLHLQSPVIFCNAASSKGNLSPDPGAVVLMSVEVLTRISAKRALLQMDPWHISQSLRIPAALFQHFGQSGVSGVLFSYTCKQEHGPELDVNATAVDQQFWIKMYAACCRLLYTILKHHKSETERCIAILQESTGVLLRCLEMVDINLMDQKNFVSLRVQDHVKCACFFRRIYEELRHQKDVFGQHCFKFLSDYIYIYSGHGPFRSGIRREIDDALRPGLYALLDACSADNLQYLHSVLGEGPSRSTLATLQHDYELNFKYQGKV